MFFAVEALPMPDWIMPALSEFVQVGVFFAAAAAMTAGMLAIR